ncbi:MAG: TolC family protein [Vicinamibacteria bacterium]|nr:TolC family protein [Vicinamibacteria bacterium]
MIRRLPTLIFLLALGIPTPAAAQNRLSLADAIARARSQNLDARSAASVERGAQQRITQARAGYLPKVDLSESWQRGDQPVFVFSSLLAQRQFTESNFAIDALNHPDAVDNFRAALTVEQALLNPATSANVRAARISHDVATLGRQLVDQDLAVAVTDAYGHVLISAASKQAAAAAVEAAGADRELASNRRDAGLVTDADVLQLDVHLARTREQQIRADSEERIARARLNQVMGEPLDSLFILDAALDAAALAVNDVPSLEAEALKNRADVKLASLQEQLAGAARDAARAGFLPQVTAQAGWEANGGQWNSRAGSWVVGVVARINLLQGFGDRARVAEAREQMTRGALARERAETAARLDVRVALARLDAARASEAAGRVAAEQARESRRIIRDRYEGGLTDVASLLRAAEAVQQAETRQIAAKVDVMLTAATLERALGK